MHHSFSCSWGETSFLAVLEKSVNSRRLYPLYGVMCDIANAIRIRTRHSIVWEWCIFLDQLLINLHFVGTRYETRGWERTMTAHLRASKHLYFRQLDKQFYELDWIDHFLSTARSAIKCTTLSERLLFLSPRPTTLPLIRHPSNSWSHHSPRCPVDWRCSVHWSLSSSFVVLLNFRTTTLPEQRERRVRSRFVAERITYLSQFIQQKERVHCWSVLNVFFDIVLWMTFGTGHQRKTLAIFNLVNVLRNTGDNFVNHTGSFVGFLNVFISVRLKDSSTHEHLRSRGDISLLSQTTIPLFCQSSSLFVYVERVPCGPVEKSRRWSSQSCRQCCDWLSLDSCTQTDESRESKDEVITFLLLRG